MTVDKQGCSNSSDKFQELCDEVERLIQQDALNRIAADATARLIMAQLAHVHGMVPMSEIDKT